MKQVRTYRHTGLLHYFLFLSGVAGFLFYNVYTLAQSGIITLSPSSALAGGGGLSVTVTGTGFASNSVVQFNGSPRSFSLVSSTQLSISLTAADLDDSGTNIIYVSGASAGFSVYPVISSLSPSSAVVGGPAFTLTVNGAGFTSDNGGFVLWDGSYLTTAFVSKNQMLAAVPAANIATTGSAAVTAFNYFSQLTSAPVTFSIDNPTPSVSSISPSSATAGGIAFTLNVNGSGFASNSVIRWNGANRSTSYVSPTLLQTSVPAGDIAAVGTSTVTVYNPAPGGGITVPIPFTVNAPKISLSPTALDFGDVLVGSPTSRTVTLTNLESSSIQVSVSTSFGSPYTVSPSTVTLGGNSSSTVTITFTPPAVAPYEAITSFLVSAGGETILGLAGRGVSSLLTFTYAVSAQTPISVLPGGTIPFPTTDVGSSSSVQVRVVNAAPSPDTINTVNSNSPLFAVSDLPSLPATLAQNNSLTFTVTFSPAAAGSFNGSLAVNNLTFNLSGAATVSPLTYRYTLSAQPPISLSPGGTLSFPATTNGSTSTAQFEIVNAGASAATLSNISSGGSAFALANLPALPTTVPGGGTLSFSVQFRPTTPAASTGTLTVGNRSFVLAGTGLASGVTLTGITDVSPPAQQPKVGVDLGSPYPVPLTGQILLTFSSTADVPSDDPVVQFASGGRVANFTIPANSSKAQFDGAPDIAFSTGTVAGNLKLAVVLKNGSADITPSPDPGRTIVVERQPPVITSVTLGSRTASGFEISITGYSTTRSLTQAVFQFAPNAGSNVQGGTVTLNVDNLFTTWYQGDEGKSFGSQFRLRIPFTVQGDVNAIGSVSLTLTNAVGASQAASANF